MKKSVKVLVVEDQSLIAKDAVEIIESLGHTSVGVARNADDAIWLMKMEEPDLVLLDIVIEGSKDGISLAGMIREEFKVAIVFVSSHADKATITRASAVNPNGYLVKPFTEGRMAAAIATAISNYKPSHDTLDMVQVNDALHRDGLSAQALERVTDFVDRRLDQKISISELASSCEIAESGFPARFKKTTGESPYQFVVARRIHEAKRLLRHTETPIAQIAMCVGYSNQAHFSTAFRKTVGITPGQYRSA